MEADGKNNATESVFEQWPCVKARGRPDIYRAKGRQTTAAAVTAAHLDGTQREGKREASPICLLCLLPAAPAGPPIGKTILKVRHCGTAKHHVMFEISPRGSIVQTGGGDQHSEILTSSVAGVSHSERRSAPSPPRARRRQLPLIHL